MPTTSLTSHEPHINNPPVYAGKLSFFSNSVLSGVLTPTSDSSRVAYVFSLLAGWAHDWGAAIQDSRSTYCEDFKLFKNEMIKVFDRSVFGKEAS